MRITLTKFSMACGGAERVMAILANYWADRGDNVTLITIDSLKSDYYSLDHRINRVALDLKKNSLSIFNGMKNNITRVRRLRAAVKNSNPDVVVSFLDRTNVLTLVSTKWLDVPVVVSEHTDPRQIPPGGVWNYLRRLTYPWASAVIVLTEELKTVVSEIVENSRIHVIPNPVHDTKGNKDTFIRFRLPSPYIAAMGRLVPVKGFDMLLEAFAKCDSKEWSLVILGEGPERKRIEKISEELGLTSQVYLLGNVKEPSAILRKAELFVLSSHSEGFPMAILEAMSCGLPVVSFDCPTGPSEIIRDGIDGVLVPAGNVNQLAISIDQMMKDDRERARLSKRAREIVNRFSLDKIMGYWDAVLSRVIKS